MAIIPPDPDASPLFGIPEQLPPIYIQVGRDEILRDDSTRYACQAAALGAEVKLDIYGGMHHVFQRDVGVLDTASVALERAAAFITAAWSAIDAGYPSSKRATSHSKSSAAASTPRTQRPRHEQPTGSRPPPGQDWRCGR
ncbi:MAG: hypothetical protein C0465_19635 [Ralstonia sp.]|nr:hypothetical protein [Ralstonia sp.]MBA4232814.1 hypothetical protein [Ralstonia sp.]MBA4236984.1 hypothetical protein [Ralstonia sp.]MBA4403623.1 hypothetical protein [Ralstonia sp.]POH86010.1 hypothetical protein CJ026_003255 [Ralstonia pickettii]